MRRCQPKPPTQTALLALLFAMTFPTLAAWSYFLGLAEQGGERNVWQQVAYIAGKVVQFGFPLVFLGVVENRLPHWTRPRSRRDWPSAWASDCSSSCLMLGIYFGALARLGDTATNAGGIAAEIRAVRDGDAGTLCGSGRVHRGGAFVAGGILLALVRVRTFAANPDATPAIALSSLAFMAHHVVVLYVYLPDKFWTAALPFSLPIAVGGAVWAWLYERSGGIWSPWLSHLLVDAGIFVIGWDLCGRSHG